MRSQNEQKNNIDANTLKELQVLTEVIASPHITQRQLSQRVGIALGLTNTILVNLTKKGYIRMGKASWRRRLYTLTPEGFSYKIKLTLGYVRRFIDDYRKIRHTLIEELQPLNLYEPSRIAMYGTSEFAELVYLALQDLGVEDIEMFGAKETAGRKFLGVTINDISMLDAKRFDKILISDINDVESSIEKLASIGVVPVQMMSFFYDGTLRVN